MLIPGILLALATVSVAVGIAYYAIFDKRHKKLPPYSPETLWQNLQASTVQKSLFQVERFRKFLLGVDPKSPAVSEQGSTFMLALPALNYFFVTSDCVLARGVLCGDNGIVEAEKSGMNRIMNLVDASQDNIITQGNRACILQLQSEPHLAARKIGVGGAVCEVPADRGERRHRGL
jgi:hypothetical protein